MSRRATATLPRLMLAIILATFTLTTQPAMAQFPDREPGNTEIVFGCNPGPIEPHYGHDPALPPQSLPDDSASPQAARLVVTARGDEPPIAGTGFNLEHTLWSCPRFRPSLGRRLLEPIRPSLIRIDSGQLPLVPDGVTADELTPEMIQGIMADPRYQPSWDLIRRLNSRNIYLLLGVWGAPGAFTHDGTRRGALLPEHIDGYVTYYTTVVDYLVKHQGLSIWAGTIMNEPDGGDGTFIPPDDLAEIARRLGPALAPYGVKLYGPDTASAENAMAYTPLLLDDPAITPYLAAIGVHQYYPSPFVADLIQSVRDAGSDLPVIITEYTSFGFGELDRGQESNDEVGFMLDIANTLVFLHNAGVDAALYWDAVDYYQAGHAALTAWGFLAGPDDAFFPRKRYFGMLQILSYLQPGAQILESVPSGAPKLSALAIHTPGDGRQDLAIALINRGGPVDLQFYLQDVPDVDSLEVYLTDEDNDREHQGRVKVSSGMGTVYLPPRSIVTLAPAAAPDET